ncbi:MAG: glycoside hydrolase family 38 C-terminal domain-containing protein [Chloroflexota bacterium]
MDIVAAESTNLFIGTEESPRQVAVILVRGSDAGDREPAQVEIRGSRLATDRALSVGPLAPNEVARLEIGVGVEDPIEAGESRDAEVVLRFGSDERRFTFDFVVAEPGWRMFMISHFHYDPVWWNTQAAYTETWGTTIQYRQPFQEPGLALVRAHLEIARSDPDYKFVLAELDYLKPYWDAYPEEREYVRQLLADDRLEFVGGTYNEPNTNLTSAESTIRNAIYGIGYQRDVLGGSPATAWQLDAFGHDPQFPGIMADAGVTSSSWARGPFHEWGPNWVRGAGRMTFAEMAAGELPRMQFPMEFDWISPSGRSLLTSFMADHYSAGWWMDAAPTLEAAETEVHRLFTELATMAATKNVLLPVGTDYSPPNKWLTAIHRDWNRRYVWPRFIAAIPREFFDAVREANAASGRRFSPQTRDMNPIYTGKDVSFIDTKQAQRIAENTLLSAEKFATIAALLGARYPTEATDKAWRQLLFGAHHDGITGSESDQVYLDLLGGWREAVELGRTVLDGALTYLGGLVDTTGDGIAVTVFNPLSWPRSDIVRVDLDLSGVGSAGIDLVDDAGTLVPFLAETIERDEDGAPSAATIAFVARDVPALGYRTYRALPGATRLDDAGWRKADATTIENAAFALSVAADRGGAIASLVDKRTGKELVRPSEVANELRVYREYPNHPLFAEGPWHLTPDGRFTSATAFPAEITVETSPIGQRIRVEGPFESSQRRQEIRLWTDVDRVELTTSLHDYSDHDRLFRVRFPAAVEGGTAISEVGNAVVGRPFGTPNVDVAEVPFTLDHPAYNWFALGATARVELIDEAEPSAVRASHAISVAEVVAPDDARLDPSLRDLVVALVRQGVTSTLTRDEGHRYGVLHIDSNLPDVRVAVGGPDENAFVSKLLAAVEPGYRADVDRQLTARGWARLWIPEERASDGREPIPDLRDARALPVLVVAGRDADATVEAIEALIADLGEGRVAVGQPATLDGMDEVVEDYTIAILNRGLPGFNVEADGNLYLSLMRSCSGWPSGVWIDPPRRATPDGSNFQFQHWSHHFEYALAAGRGDWRDGGMVRIGHEYNTPLIARTFDNHDGRLPAATSFIEVKPASVVLTALKPAGNPASRMASMDVDPVSRVALRLYESSGRPTHATIHSRWPVGDASLTDILEGAGEPLRAEAAVEVSLDPYQIATVSASLPSSGGEARDRTDLAPRAEPAQPVFADYWLHNKGAAPMGYQAVTVQIRPSLMSADGPFNVPIVVASERTDEAVAGTVAVIVPPGWDASPPERIYRLAPGSHLELNVAITPASGATPGRYFVAARIADEVGQDHEDVVTVDLTPSGDGGAPSNPGADERSPELRAAVERALAVAGVEVDSADAAAGPGTRHEPERELQVELLGDDLAVRAGDEAHLRMTLRNLCAAEIRGEAQVLSPYDTWSTIIPWTQPFSVDGGGQATLTFRVAPPRNASPGTYWALVKVMYFGRIWYTESVPVTILAPSVVSVAEAVAGR